MSPTAVRLIRPRSFSNRLETIKKQREDEFLKNRTLARKQSQTRIQTGASRHRSFTMGHGEMPKIIPGAAGEGDSSISPVSPNPSVNPIMANTDIQKRLRRWKRTSFSRDAVVISNQIARDRARKKMIDAQSERVSTELPLFIGLESLSAAEPILSKLASAYASQLGDKHVITGQARARHASIQDVLSLH